MKAPTLSVVLRTLDRFPRVNYLVDTLKNLKRGGLLTAPCVQGFQIVDSGSSMAFLQSALAEAEYPTRVVMVDRPDKRRTHNRNAARAIELATLQPAHFILVLEDDIDVCADFFIGVSKWLKRHAAKEYPLYTFGATWPGVAVAAQNNLSSCEIAVDNFYGAQAYAVPMDYAVDLSRWHYDHLTYTKADGTQVTQCHDLLLHDWAKTLGAKQFLASAPSFVQHTGRDSALNNEFFEFPTWPGREWRFQ